MASLDRYAQPMRERADHYRKQAAKALSDAERTTDPAMRASFLLIADGWRRLAAHCEAADEAASILPWLDSGFLNTDEGPVE